VSLGYTWLLIPEVSHSVKGRGVHEVERKNESQEE
jgi:hypothetical protein